MKKKLLLVGVVLLSIGALYGYYMYNKPVQSLKNAKVAHEISAVALHSAYETAEVEANSRFLDKIIEVAGRVEKVEEENGQWTIYLATEGMMSSVICELEKGTSAVGVKKGDQIKVKGLCTGYLMDVVLVRSVITS